MLGDAIFVLGISILAAFLTALGGIVAEFRNVPQRVVARMLQFAGGVLTALVAATLMVPAINGGNPPAILLAFFIGGASFVVMDFTIARREAAKRDAELASASTSLFIGVWVDMLIDGIVIGLASTMTLGTGLALAISIALSTAPLALVSMSLAREKQMAARSRHLLLAFFALALIGGAIFGYLVLRGASPDARLTLVAIASGFLITTVTQSIIPEANRDGEPSLAALYFVGGISLYALFSLSVF
jgi:ZIP family zinc transporter